MKDLLEFPNCKLYDNGRFRLPNKVRKQFENGRVKQLVIIPAKNNKLKLIPASWWERMKAEEKKEIPVDFLIRPQSLKATFLELHPELIDYLKATENIYFEADGKLFLLWNDADYDHRHKFRKKQLHIITHGVKK